MTRYDELIQRRRYQLGAQFDPMKLAPRFVPYFNTGERIRVRFKHGEELTGTVGVTMGWQPAFLLMLRRNSIGSPWILGEGDEVIAVKSGRGYVTASDKASQGFYIVGRHTSVAWFPHREEAETECSQMNQRGGTCYRVQPASEKW